MERGILFRWSKAWTIVIQDPGVWAPRAPLLPWPLILLSLSLSLAAAYLAALSISERNAKEKMAQGGQITWPLVNSALGRSKEEENTTRGRKR